MKAIRDMDEVELKDYFTAMAKHTEAALPPGTLFALLVFDDPMIAQYVSNARRRDIISAMRECANRLEANEDVRRYREDDRHKRN